MTERESGRAGERETRRPEPPGPPDARSASSGPGAADSRPEPADAGSSSSPGLPLSRSAVSAQTLIWLDARESPPPPELRAHIARALEGVRAETVPGALAEAALACLQTTLAAPQARETAPDLLTADALLTYALEAAAELGASTLREIVELYGPGALAPLVPLEEPGGPGGAVGPAAPAAPGGSPAVPPESLESPGSPAPEAP